MGYEGGERLGPSACSGLRAQGSELRTQGAGRRIKAFGLLIAKISGRRKKGKKKEAVVL